VFILPAMGSREDHREGDSTMLLIEFEADA
jgi:hypothetical protein